MLYFSEILKQNDVNFKGYFRQYPKSQTVEIADKRFENLLKSFPLAFLNSQLRKIIEKILGSFEN